MEEVCSICEFSGCVDFFLRQYMIYCFLCWCSILFTLPQVWKWRPDPSETFFTSCGDAIVNLRGERLWDDMGCSHLSDDHQEYHSPSMNWWMSPEELLQWLEDNPFLLKWPLFRWHVSLWGCNYILARDLARGRTSQDIYAATFVLTSKTYIRQDMQWRYLGWLLEPGRKHYHSHLHADRMFPFRNWIELNW